MRRLLPLLLLLLLLLTMTGITGCRTYCERQYGITEYTSYPTPPERPVLNDIVFDGVPDLFINKDGTWKPGAEDFYNMYIEQKEELKTTIRLWEAWRDSVYALNPPLPE